MKEEKEAKTDEEIKKFKEDRKRKEKESKKKFFADKNWMAFKVVFDKTKLVSGALPAQPEGLSDQDNQMATGKAKPKIEFNPKNLETWYFNLEAT